MVGQQHGGLDVNEPRGHLQKFAGNLQAAFAHLLDGAQILLEQLGNLDIINIQLVPGYQLQDEVERALIFLHPET